MNLNLIKSNLDLFKLISNSIEDKWDANWCKTYWNFSLDYDFEKKWWKDKDPKRHFFNPFYLTWKSTKYISTWNCNPKRRLMELKLFLPKPKLKLIFNLNFMLTWMKVIIFKRVKKDKYQNHYIAQFFPILHCSSMEHTHPSYSCIILEISPYIASS
jgi:hypothetical protein